MKTIHSIAGIILAAGASERMENPKPLLAFPDGTTLLASQVQLLRSAGCDEVAVVVGAHADKIQSSHKEIEVTWLTNEHWEVGQFSSIQVGLSRVLQTEATGAIILPVDTAFVSHSTIQAIIDTALRNPHLEAIVPEYGEDSGHPVYISKGFGETLARIDPQDEAARLDTQLRGANHVMRLPVNDPNITCNINTPQDWQNQLQNYGTANV